MALVAAKRSHFALLQHPQQLGLQGQRHVADFVQKQGPAIGRVEQPFPVLVGAGEGPLAVAEQFAFQQLLGQRAAVLSNKGLAAA